MGTIKVSCEGNELRDIGEIEGFQGSLKSLSNENLKKLKEQIVKHGFTAPFHVWESDKSYLIDGHQRLRAVRSLQEDGYTVPPLPIVKIHAATREEAKRILLSHASVYGQIEEDGLVDFLEDAKIELCDLEDFSLDIDIEVDEKDEDEQTEKKPTRTTDGYVDLSLTMKVEERNLILDRINAVQYENKLQTKVDALLMIVRGEA